jgi:hypothetical protein
MLEFGKLFEGQIFEAGFALAVCLVALHWYNHRKVILFTDAAKVLGSAWVFMMGLAICVKAVLNIACCTEIPERAYLFVGALFAIWNTASAINVIIRKSKPQ